MDLSAYNVYWLLAVNGFFVGVGGVIASLIGNFLWHEWLKPRLVKWHKRVKKKKFKVSASSLFSRFKYLVSEKEEMVILVFFLFAMVLRASFR